MLVNVVMVSANGPAECKSRGLGCKNGDGGCRKCSPWEGERLASEQMQREGGASSWLTLNVQCTLV